MKSIEQIRKENLKSNPYNGNEGTVDAYKPPSYEYKQPSYEYKNPYEID